MHRHGLGFDTCLWCVVLLVQAEFFADMDALGVRRPDVLTRVVEYLPEIISYVEVSKPRVLTASIYGGRVCCADT